ncbi:MAG: SDR family NAD(P)-dependent oxidoreductase [Candidatus Bathyarchaeota archaeon]|nr:SDR family NAD(P)-dependent oxidoreductase [Candidatus Bathyarchaeota archaeon]
MSKPNKKILVTGGAGFIGSHLVSLLLEKGYLVVVLDNLSSGKQENLNAVRENPHFRFVRGDIRDPAVIQEAMDGADAVVHLAALIDVAASVADPALTHEVNVTGTLNVLQAAVKCGVSRFVFASSTAVYGDVQSLPVKESEVLQPISPYAASKAACEAYCSAFAGSFGVDVAALRFFNVYGPKNENSPYSGVITKFLRQATSDQVLTVEGDGEQTRDFIHVSDIAKALTLALEAKHLCSKVFNVCTGVPTSINGLVDALRTVTGKDLHVKYCPSRVGDIRFSYGDGSKAAEELGFTAHVNMLEGLRLLFDAYAKAD